MTAPLADRLLRERDKEPVKSDTVWLQRFWLRVWLLCFLLSFIVQPLVDSPLFRHGWSLMYLAIVIVLADNTGQLVKECGYSPNVASLVSIVSAVMFFVLIPIIPLVVFMLGRDALNREQEAAG